MPHGSLRVRMVQGGDGVGEERAVVLTCGPETPDAIQHIDIIDKYRYIYLS